MGFRLPEIRAMSLRELSYYTTAIVTKVRWERGEKEPDDDDRYSQAAEAAFLNPAYEGF